jgi:hypothetical protein
MNYNKLCEIILKNSHNSLEYIIKQKTNIGHDKNYIS